MHLQDFITYLKYEKRYSPNTVLAYQKDLEQFSFFVEQQFGLVDLLQISHIQIRSWLATIKQEGIESRSINRKISSLKSFFKFLQRKGLIQKLPTSKIISPKAKKRLPIFVREEEMQDLLNHQKFSNDFKGRTNWLILELLYQTGMRKSELIHLKLNRVDLGSKQLRVIGKGNKERIIPISQELSLAIQDYVLLRSNLANIESDNLLVLASGKDLYPKYVYTIVRNYLGQFTTLSKRSPHVLRHTFATHLLNNGAELNAVKELLGHASLAATQIYTHNSIQKLKNVYKKAHPKS